MTRTSTRRAGTELWRPSEASLATESRTAGNFRVIGRLNDGVSLEQARTDLSAVGGRLKLRYGGDTAMAGAALVPLHEELFGDVRPALLVPLGAAGFLLLIACANVVRLLVGQGARLALVGLRHLGGAIVDGRSQSGS